MYRNQRKWDCVCWGDGKVQASWTLAPSVPGLSFHLQGPAFLQSAFPLAAQEWHISTHPEDAHAFQGGWNSGVSVGGLVQLVSHA